MRPLFFLRPFTMTLVFARGAEGVAVRLTLPADRPRKPIVETAYSSVKTLKSGLFRLDLRNVMTARNFGHCGNPTNHCEEVVAFWFLIVDSSPDSFLKSTIKNQKSRTLRSERH